MAWKIEKGKSVMRMFTIRKTNTVHRHTRQKPLKKILTPTLFVTLLFAFGLAVSFSAGGVFASNPCSIDAQGANDEPGQKDLTQFCDNGISGGNLSISWSWDEVAWSGNNTGDSCALFDDSDADANVDYAVCVTVKGSPAVQAANSPRIYSCNNGDVDNCTGSQLVAGVYTSSCGISKQSTDPFAGPAAKQKGAAFPSDTVVTCSIAPAEVGGITTVKDVCSYPSQQPNSDPSDCVVIATGGASPVIQLVKDVQPDNDTGKFNLRIDLATDAVVENIGDGGATQEVEFPSDAKTIVVEESAYADTTLGYYTTSLHCVDDENPTASPFYSSTSVTGESTRTASVPVPKGVLDITCTFVNTRQTGGVKLIKTVVNDNNGTLGENSFGLSIGGTSVKSGEQLSLSVGVPVVVQEAGASGYSFVSITGTGCPSVLGGTVTPVAGQVITCTITNDDQPATLTVVKKFANKYGGTTDPTQFTFAVNGDAPVAFEGDGSNQLAVNAGTYSVTETAKSGFGAPTYEGCSNVVLTVGGSATCTITNHDLPATLIVKKVVLNDNGGTAEAADFSFSVNGGEATAFNTDGTDTLKGKNTFQLATGVYSVSETKADGYSVSYDGCSEVAVANGETKTCTITNEAIAPKLTLVKAVANDDGGTAEPTAWTLTAKAADVTAMSGVSGSQAVTEVPVKAGVAYTLGESGGPTGYQAEGWQCDGGTLRGDAVTLALAQNVTCTITNNDIAPKLTVRKVTNPATSVQPFSFAVSNEAGDAEFALDTSDTTVTPNERAASPLKAGIVTITEAQTEGWVLANVDCSQGAVFTRDGTNVSVTLNPGDDITCTFTNEQLATVTVVKFHDTNENGVKDEDESVLSGWVMNLEEDCEKECPSAAQTTGTNGEAIFTNVPAGSYVLGETLKEGWAQSNMYCGRSGESRVTDNSLPVSIAAGDDVRCYVGNVMPLRLLLSKTNNAPDVKQVGDTVQYTLVVTNPEDSGYAEAAVVTDTPPKGFEYVLGSWTAVSNIRGDLKAASITTEPTYHSPGDWQLGDMLPGEVVTLTYLAKIVSASDGVYPDSAFASAGSVLGAFTAFSNVTVTPDNPFVTTAVRVDSPVTPPAQQVGVVLGVSTTLQNTGQKIILGMLFALTLVIASCLTFFRKKQFSWKKVRAAVVAVLVLAVCSLGGSRAFAVTAYWTTNISTPEAQTSTGQFGINYQVLSTTPSDTFTVQLYQNGVLAATQNVATDNGDSGVFPITLASEGTYTYYIKTTHGGNPADVKQSATRTVSFDKTAPAAPVQVLKTPISGGYTVSFLVPAGTEAAQVEIYAATTTSFTANAATLVRTMSATPGAQQSSALSVSDGQPRYFAVRTVDSFGNASVLVAESVQVQATTANTTTATTTASTTRATAATTQNAAVLGTTTEDQAQQATTSTSSEGTVLSAQTDQSDEALMSTTGETNKSETKKKNPLVWALVLVVPVAAGILIALLAKKPK